MKTVYFVRHGESENNASDRYNEVDTQLSEKGRQQAMEIAKRCAKLPIELLISSDMVRARQTSKVIVSHNKVPIEVHDFFRERISATSILGKRRDDPHAMEVIRNSRANFHVPGWRFEDGENFEDLKKRALQGLELLEKKKEDSILVVSHGFFMRIMVAALIFGRDLTSQECMHIADGLGDLENTGLTVANFLGDVGAGKRSSWLLRVWNDHAHLG